jgi:hypothetical protein
MLFVRVVGCLIALTAFSELSFVFKNQVFGIAISQAARISHSGAVCE